MNSVINTRATNPRGASLDDWSVAPRKLLLRDLSAPATSGLLRKKVSIWQTIIAAYFFLTFYNCSLDFLQPRFDL